MQKPVPPADHPKDPASVTKVSATVQTHAFVAASMVPG